jgi:capsular polysaccharide transport system permease protein
LSERPISEFWKTQDRKAGKNPAASPHNRGEQTGPREDSSDNDGLYDPDEALWDPEVKPDQKANPKQLPVKLPRREPNQALATEIDSPAPVLRQMTQFAALNDITFLQALPQRTRGRSWAGLIWFALFVITPIVLATYYYYRVASDQYVAEFRFTVKDATAQGANTVGAASNGLLAILGSSGSTNTNNYIVVDYLTSMEAIQALQQRINIVDLYSKPSIDTWSRFNRLLPIESFARYWQYALTAHFDPVTGIASARVRAFSPQDALLIANTMVKLSEDLVNEIAIRSQKDAVRFSQGEVDKAEQRLRQIRDRLTEYRNRVGVIDPSTSVVASAATLIQTLRATLATQEAQLATMMRQNLLPTAPTVIVLKNQIQSTKEQISGLERSVGKNTEGASLSKIMGEYEQLDLERQFAQTMVTGALQALDQARANAAAQHLYITPYVRPTLPTTSTYPQRAVSVLKVAAIAIVLWLIGLLAVRSVRERFA